MKSVYVLSVILFSLVGCSSRKEPGSEFAGGKHPATTELTFKAADGHLVYADLYASKRPDPKAVVLMFHQAGSNAGEYETIAPSISARGFDCIAVDQRSGGDMWGRSNRTSSQSGAGDYMAAYSDLLGALKYAQAKKYTTIIAWGSSYSASLVLKLAAENPQVAGVLTFSPGEYMDDKSIVAGWAAKVTVPTLLACTPDEWSDGRAFLFDKLGSKDKLSVHLPGGVHGSSTLIDEKSTAAPQYMQKVQAFLARYSRKH